MEPLVGVHFNLGALLSAEYNYSCDTSTHAPDARCSMQEQGPVQVLRLMLPDSVKGEGPRKEGRERGVVVWASRENPRYISFLGAGDMEGDGT
jgi:hypothetical protein